MRYGRHNGFDTCHGTVGQVGKRTGVSRIAPDP